MRDIHIPLNEGDWVSGKTANDEKFRGYVERIDLDGSFMKVRVLESDRTAIIGKSVDAAFVTIESIATEGPRTETELLSVIDLALQTRDRVWFDELSIQLAALNSDGASPRGLRPERGGTYPKSRVG